jgi:hypothetical protein
MIRLQFDNHYEINVEKNQIAHVRSAEALMTFLDVNRDHFRELKGVYIISAFDTEDVGTPRPIYVGKAKNLYNRLYEHCKEMMPERCSEIKQLKDKKWIDAFSPYRRQVNLFQLGLQKQVILIQMVNQLPFLLH